ncbi:ubiquinol-cytochrome c reductase cytochrome b subunit [Streptomyces sp. NPDC051976]|uniref:cytochrome bc1 complex cytochrome b subunit n=1 Tax=Streptomyces sp. NPDC051976 TaxID=3154947 RepID=UPI0034155C15
MTTTTDAPRGTGTPGGPSSKAAAAGQAAARWADGRTGLYALARSNLRKIFPDHWSFMLGEIALYSFVIIILTGVWLTLFFVPSMGEVVYHGPYTPLNGVTMSEAYASTMHISFEVRGGLLMRQVHHWAALVFVGAMLVHMMRIFFTGAFRKPRELNWLIGATLLILGMFDGFMGYSLPDDLLSGTGLRFMEGAILSVPIVGSYLSMFVYGGEFPGSAIIPRLFTVHVLLIPGIMAGLLVAHLMLVFYHKHTQFAGAGKTNRNVVGMPLLPIYMAKAGGFFFLVFGVICVMASVASVNSIWAYGPYRADQVSTDAQPDWYMGYSEGLLRIMPGWEIRAWGHTLVLGVFIPLVVFPLVLGALWAYPFIESWVTGDKSEHHILDRPRNAPIRTGFGAAWIALYMVLLAGGGNDLLATHFSLSLNSITWAVRIGIFVVPPIVFVFTKRLCLGLQRRDKDKVLHGHESGIIERLPYGAYVEVHHPLSQTQVHMLTAHKQYQPAELPPSVDENGVERKVSRLTKFRVRLSESYFGESGQIAKPTAEEYNETTSGHH